MNWFETPLLTRAGEQMRAQAKAEQQEHERQINELHGTFEMMRRMDERFATGREVAKRIGSLWPVQ